MKTTYDRIQIKTLLEQVNDKKIRLPSFQRHLAWNKEKKSRLISSLVNGYPVGVLLLGKRDGVTHLIDGLQRVNTIISYIQNRSEFIDINNVKEEWIETLRSLFLKDKPSSFDNAYLQRLILDFIRGPLDKMRLQNLVASGLDLTLVYVNSVMNNNDPQINNFLIDAKNALGIEDLFLHFMQIEGSEEEQAKAFELLNTGAESLSKYDIVAAQWNRPCRVVDKNLLSKIRTYWLERIQEVELQIDGIQPDGTPEVITLFDVLIGLGNLLADDFPLLIDSKWKNEIAFQIAAVANEVQLTSLYQTEKKFIDKFLDETVIDVTNFIKAVKLSAKSVNDALKPVLGMKLSSTNVRTQFQNHQMLQASWMITEVLCRDGISKDWSTEFKPLTPGEKKGLQRWYLYDRLSKHWKNAGDSLMYRRIWAKNETASQYSSLTDQSPTRNQMISTLNNWFLDQMQSENLGRRNISSEAKLILRYFYSQLVSYYSHESTVFEIDHLIPIVFAQRIYDLSESKGGPINSIGNLALMKHEVHATKATKLIPEWLETSGFRKSYNMETIVHDCLLISEENWNFLTSLQDRITSSGIDDQTIANDFNQNLKIIAEARWEIIATNVADSLY